MARGTISRKNYLNCSTGKWREKVDQDTRGAVSRFTQPLDGSEGKKVWEIVDDYVEGEIIDIKKEHHEEYGDKWEVTIKDGTAKLVLRVRYDSGYAMAMLAKLPNADLKRPIMFIPYYFPEEKKARMVLKQEGMDIPTFYSKEDPKGFPSLAENASENDVKRWKLDAMDFLEKMVEEIIRPQLPEKDDSDEMSGYENRSEGDPGSGGSSEGAAENSGGSDQSERDPGPGPNDDLPF